MREHGTQTELMNVETSEDGTIRSVPPPGGTRGA